MSTRYRWFVVFTFFLFILLHQADKLLIGPLTTPIMEAFRINEAQMGWVFTGALVVGAVCYWLWGWLYDRFVRTRLLALASLLWGATTWLNALVRTFPGFIATRAATGIDDSSYPGLYNVVADYFEPQKRGKVNGHPGAGHAAGLPGGHGAGPDDAAERGLARGVLHHRLPRGGPVRADLVRGPGAAARGQRAGAAGHPAEEGVPLQLEGSRGPVQEAQPPADLLPVPVRGVPLAGDHLLVLPLPGDRAGVLARCRSC